VKLIFLSLPTADLAVARVKARAAQGGHDVPEEVIRRRFDMGLSNFNNLYRQLVSSWALYDNSVRPSVMFLAGDNP
jgi:predicted ABC-type ATPase